MWQHAIGLNTKHHAAAHGQKKGSSSVDPRHIM